MPRTSPGSRLSRNSRRDTTPRYSDADLEPLLQALAALRDGDFREKSHGEADGAVAEAAVMVEQIRLRALHEHDELARVRREISREGHVEERLSPGPGSGSWAAGLEAANALIDALAGPAAAITKVVDAVAAGDLSQKVELR